MSFKERWTKKFAETLTKDEKKAFRLRLDFSEGRGACIQGLVHIQLHRSSTRTPFNGLPRARGKNAF